MKVSFYTFLLFILFSFYSFNQTPEWTWVNPYPSGEQIIQSYFLSEQKGFVIGKVGTLLGTTDGGITWGQIETSMVNGDFLKILFTDDLNGKALGSELGPNYSPHPYFIMSSNGGVTWEQYTVTQQIVFLRDMFFINDQIGWLIGNDGALFHTTDGGLSWVDKSISQVSGTTFNKIIFTNESDGVVLGFNTQQYPYTFIVGHSTNGGTSWELKYSPLINQGSFSTDIIADNTFITAGSSGLILKSVDNCNSWFFRMGLPILDLTSVDFKDSLFGLLGTISGQIMRTFDGGINWITNSTGYNAQITSVQCVSNSFLTSSGIENEPSSTNSYILTSSNAGNNWTNHTRFISNPINVSTISLLNNDIVFICGSTNSSGAIIYKTSNAGINWQQSYFLASGYLSDIEVLNADKIIASGGNYSNGIILISTNGGSNWLTKNITTISGISGLSIPDSSAMYAFATNHILKSTDSGNTWSIIYQPTYAGFNDIEFVSPDVGYLVGGSYPSNIYKTTNGGLNWNMYNIFSNSEAFNISFPSETIGYASGSGNLYKTMNGGISWVQLYVPNVYTFHDIEFKDEQNGWVIGSYGIYVTSDGGQTWEFEFGKSDYSVHTFGIKRGIGLWAAGQDAKIIKYNDELPTTITPGIITTKLPTEFALEQNYPNPFNPGTTFKYSIPQSSKVVIKVYDILGNEIAILIDEEKIVGTYELTWNAENLPSGVYFYQLKAGDYVSTKKMILLK